MDEYNRRRLENDGFGFGVLAGLGLTLLAIGVCAALRGMPGLSAFFDTAWQYIGVTQLVYVIPVLIVLWRKGLTLAALGVMTMAAVVFLINFACGIILHSIR